MSRIFPGRNIEVISRRQMWDGGRKGQARTLHACRGEAFVYFFRSLEEVRQPALIAASSLVHGCRKNVIIDVQGTVTRMTWVDVLTLFPRAAAAALYEAGVFAVSWLILKCMARDARAATSASARPAEIDLLYAHPYPFSFTPAGGAMSHVRGVLQGLVESSATCKIYSGTSLGFTGFDSKVSRQSAVLRSLPKLKRSSITGGLPDGFSRILGAGGYGNLPAARTVRSSRIPAGPFVEGTADSRVQPFRGLVCRAALASGSLYAMVAAL